MRRLHDIKYVKVFVNEKSSPRSLKSEILRVLLVIIVVTSIVFGVSKADELPILKDFVSNSGEVQKTFSTRGQTGEFSDSTVIIYNAKNPQGEKGFTYTVDVSSAVIKSYTGDTLSLSDIKKDQEVLAKGLLEGDIIKAHTFIIFGDLTPLDIATTTATTTDATSTATTTEETTSTTDTSSSTPSEETSTTTEDTSTTTPEELIETSSTTDDTTGGIVETVVETIEDIVDTVAETITDTLDQITGNNEEEPTPTPQEETPTPPSEEIPTPSNYSPPQE